MYKKIAKYNIFNRTLNLFRESKMPLSIYGKEDGFKDLGVFIKLSDRSIGLFDFSYKSSLSLNDKTIDEYNTMKIGSIFLYQTLENKELREAELVSKEVLSDNDKKEIEITNKICNMLLKDYGLTNKDFEEEKNRAMFNNRQESKLQKTLVKRQPGLTITNNIKYI